MNTVMIREDGNWYSKKEICDVCGVGHATFERFLLNLTSEEEKYIQKRPSRKGGHLYSETILKQFQAWLMRNQTNQGKSSQLVKVATTTAVSNDIALKEIINSGNVEAMKCLMEHYVNETRAVGEAKRLGQINHQLQLENKQLVNENDYLKKLNDINTAQLGYYTNRYHSWQDDYDNY